MVRFDTRALTPADKLDAWRQNIGVFFDLRAPDGARLPSGVDASITACNLGGTVFGVTESHAQWFSREDRRLSEDGMEHVLVQLFLEGGGVTEGGAEIRAGDLLVIDMDQPHSMVNSAFKNLTLVLPRESDPQLAAKLSRLHAVSLGAETPMRRFMADHLLALWRHVPSMTRDDAAAALTGTLGLMDGWLTGEGAFQQDAAPEVSLLLGRSIRRHIEANIHRPLTPEELAATFHISRSYLYQIFKPSGGVLSYIWERRLLRSMRMLSNPMFAHYNVSTIAYSCGFSSEAHFSRRFKTRFGTNASVWRRDAAGGETPRRAEAPCASDDMFPQWIRAL